LTAETVCTMLCQPKYRVESKLAINNPNDRTTNWI